MLVKHMLVKMNTIPKFGMKTKLVGGVNPSENFLVKLKIFPG